MEKKSARKKNKESQMLDDQRRCGDTVLRGLTPTETDTVVAFLRTLNNKNKKKLIEKRKKTLLHFPQYVAT